MFGHMTSEAVPDLKDIHVMYFADWCGSDYLVTYNLSAFTREASKKHQFKVVSLEVRLLARIGAIEAAVL